MKPTDPSEDLHFIVTPGGIVEAIIAAYGIAFMRKVARTLGGKELKVPRRAFTFCEGHVIVRALGLEDAIRLSELFCGESISIPKGYQLHNLPRHGEYLLQAIEAGKTVMQMADELGISMRSVRRIARKMGVKAGSSTGRNSSEAFTVAGGVASLRPPASGENRSTSQ